MKENYQSNLKKHIKSILIILLIIVIIVILYLLFFKNEKKSDEEKEQTIFEKAYSNLNFKENPSSTKIYCSINTSNGSSVSEEKILIYYFDDNKLTSYISHDDIILSNSYMDYYDEMYDKYSESLKEDNEYENIKKSIEKGDNEILITIITTESDSSNAISMPSFISPSEAKQKAIAEGYVCK